MAEGRFREDFYYRLCSDVVMLPPLRQRLAEDATELDTLLGGILCRVSGDNVPTRESELIRRIIEKNVGKSYAWPGNVRELEQAVKRVILTGHCKPVARDERMDQIGGSFPEAVRKGDLDAQALVAEYCRMLFQRFGTYEEVARRANLDRRTVKKYISGSLDSAGS